MENRSELQIMYFFIGDWIQFLTNLAYGSNESRKIIYVEAHIDDKGKPALKGILL